MENFIILLGLISALLLFFAIGDMLAIFGINVYDKWTIHRYNKAKRAFWRKVKRGQI
jgi:hypothetical protein